MISDILKHRQAVQENISKAFASNDNDTEDSAVEKARSGVYTDNSLNRKLNRVGKPYGITTVEDIKKKESEKQYKKAQSLLSALQKRGLKNFHISRSITDWGVSTYVQNPILKFRISDHSVLSTKRVVNEIHFSNDSNIELLADYALSVHNERLKKEKERDELLEKQKKEVQELNAYWETIKDDFANKVFKKIDRTYQPLSKFLVSGQRTKSDVFQKEISNGAYAYEWAEPVNYIGKFRYPDNTGFKKPSYDWLRWHRNTHNKKAMEDITKHRQAIAENIAKAFGEDIEKAHKEGDIHPNGKWYWNSSVNGGKGDWRVIRNKKGSSTTSGSAGSTGPSNTSSSYFSKLSNSLIEKYSKKKESVSLSDIEEFYEDFLRDRGQEPTRKAYANEAKKTYDAIVANWNKKSSNTVTHDINGTKVTVTKNSNGSYTLEANGKKVKSDDPSYYVFGTNIKPRVKAALAKEVGLETKKKGKIPDESEVKSMMQWMSKKNGSNWTVEDRDKAMEFMSRVPSKFKSSNRNIINAVNATLKNLYIEHNK